MTQRSESRVEIVSETSGAIAAGFFLSGQDRCFLSRKT
jgi:hypothetical protein